MQKLNVTLNTDGCGYWSDVTKAVHVNGMRIAYLNEEEDFGELRVYFDKATWNVDKDGLIYTDRQFEKELKAHLKQLGLASDDVDYSEQGMQGNNYVSLDVGKKFIQSYERYENRIPA